MKWLKKQFNKIFFAVEEEEHDLEQWELDEQEEQIEKDDQQPKKKFVFPVVDDHEQFEKKKTTPNETNHIVDGKLTLPTHIKQDGGISKVYDVEVSGIRDLLERRKSSSGRTTSRREQVKTPIKRPTFEEQPIAYREKEKKEEISKSVSLEKRRKFVPTKVPSPVYGFATPKKKNESSIIHSGKTFDEIQQEIEEKKSFETVREENVRLPQDSINITEHNELHTSDAQHEQVDFVVNPDESTFKTIVNAEIMETSEHPLFEQENSSALAYKQSHMEEKGVEKIDEQHDKTTGQVEQDDIDSIQTDKITFHNSTVHIENLTISDAQTVPVIEQEVENVVEQSSENFQSAQKEIEEQRIETRSKLPFNVLMLKSDKEKLAAKQKNEQIIENSFAPFPASASVDTNVDMHRTIPKQYIQSISSHENVVDLNGMIEISEQDQQEESEQIIEKLESTHDVIEHEGANSFEFYNESITPPFHLNDEEQMVEVEKIEELDQIDQKEEIDLLEKAIASTELNSQMVQQELRASKEVQTDVQAAQQMQEINEEVIEVAVVQVETEQQLAMPLTNELLNEPLPYTKPPLSILAPPEEMLEDTEWMEEQGENLVEALSHFQVQAQVESVVQGPAVTQFEITVGHGTKVSKVRNLSDDIQLALAARDIRIDAPIPGKRSIGIEIPNRVSRPVRLSEVTNSERFQKSDSPLEAALGLDLNGNPVTLDLRKMPHGLIAGATGSGKSVCINSILVSLLYKSAPHELKLMLIDPKMVELAPFNHIPHLVSPVITDVKAATESLKWAVDEMERRYQLFMHSGTRDITRYNKLCEENKMYAQKLPYLLIVIDELADLMMMSPADVELAISRLAQKARACGIHLILATQRPSVDVITGTLKSNIPTRIAFAVSSQIDSRTIIDQQGAERLLGRGDMLYLGNGMNAPQRIQGTFVTDEEIEEVVEYVRSQGEPNYFFKSEELVQKSEIIEEQDELFEEVCRFVYSQGSASTSSLQRRYHIGYNRAARLIDMLESQGLVSEQKGSKPRDVYITETMLEDMFS